MRIDFNNKIFDDVRNQKPLFDDYVRLEELQYLASFEPIQYWADELLFERDNIYSSFDEYDLHWIRVEVHPLISEYVSKEFQGVL